MDSDGIASHESIIIYSVGTNITVKLYRLQRAPIVCVIMLF